MTESPSPSDNLPRKRVDNGPWWVWVIAGIVLACVVGGVVGGGSKTQSRGWQTGGFPASSGDHYVPPYQRSDGTQVRGHYRTNPDSTTLNNYSGPNGTYYRGLNGRD